MRQEFMKDILPKMEKAKKQQQILRSGVSIAVLVLAALGLWQWAWLVLGLALFGLMVDVGTGIIISLTNVVAVQLPSGNTLGSNARS